MKNISLTGVKIDLHVFFQFEEEIKASLLARNYWGRDTEVISSNACHLVEVERQLTLLEKFRLSMKHN